jgi:hypothetical protein
LPADAEFGQLGGSFGGDRCFPVAAVGEEEAEADELGGAVVEDDRLFVAAGGVQVAFAGPVLGGGQEVAAFLVRVPHGPLEALPSGNGGQSEDVFAHPLLRRAELVPSQLLVSVSAPGDCGQWWGL